MEEVKGKTTMRDITHGVSGGASVSVDLSNMELLIMELTKAVKGVSMTVNVPQAGSPDVNVQVQPAALTAVPLPPTVMPAPEVKVTIPPQRLLAVFLFIFMASDVALKIICLLKP